MSQNIALISLAADVHYEKQVALGIENKREYCREHGYDFILASETQDPSRHIYWSKIRLILNTLLQGRHSWIVWMDADTLIMNQKMRLEDLIDQKYHLMISEDHNGINAGVFFLKNCPWSQAFLQSVYMRTDCLSHIWPEQQAMALEIDKQTQGAWCKLMPQRLFNSYPSELFQGPTMNYEPGDFVLHFASANQSPGMLSQLFQKYAAQVIKRQDPLSLDAHLRMQGFLLSPIGPPYNEGYITEAQGAQFKAKIESVQAIAEIGLNTGHSAEFFFQNCPLLKKFVSFDINQHSYTRHAVEYLTAKYGERFEFIEGDSAKRVPEYAQSSRKFDLIYIDGDHTQDGCVKDLMQCRALAHANTIVWVDDYHAKDVKAALQTLQEKGIIRIEKIYWCEDLHGIRCWAEISYS